MASRTTVLAVYQTLQDRNPDALLRYFALEPLEYNRALRDALFESHAAAVRRQDHTTLAWWHDAGADTVIPE